MICRSVIQLNHIFVENQCKRFAHGFLLCALHPQHKRIFDEQSDDERGIECNVSVMGNNVVALNANSTWWLFKVYKHKQIDLYAVLFCITDFENQLNALATKCNHTAYSNQYASNYLMMNQRQTGSLICCFMRQLISLNVKSKILRAKKRRKNNVNTSETIRQPKSTSAQMLIIDMSDRMGKIACKCIWIFSSLW